MRPNDDTTTQLLERDLRALAESREADESLRLALREQLIADPSPRRPRRRPRAVYRAFGSAVAAAALAAVAVAALVGTKGPVAPATADAAIIHHALKVVTPPAHRILHVKVVGVQNGVPIMAETWQQTSPPYAFRAIKGALGHGGEFAENGTSSFQYDPSTNTISRRPDSSPLTFSDPIAQVRQELARGQAHVAGAVVIHGLSLYKIDLPHGLVGYFQTSNYRPRYLDDPQRDGSVLRLRVVAYEYLPTTAANTALLSITAQHPHARVTGLRAGAN